jgi:hypothetical protein
MFAKRAERGGVRGLALDKEALCEVASKGEEGKRA